GALRAGPDERGEDAVRVVDALFVLLGLDAEVAGGDRVVSNATNLGDHAVGHGGDPGARVRAVVGTGAADVDRTHKGVLSCLRGWIRSRLGARARREPAPTALVRRGSITASTKPRSAGTSGLSSRSV